MNTEMKLLDAYKSANLQLTEQLSASETRLCSLRLVEPQNCTSLQCATEQLTRLNAALSSGNPAIVALLLC